MKKLFILFGLSCLTAFGAANGINGEVITKVGTTETVQLPGSQTTNLTISLVSKMTDGASAVAFSLNSSNVLTTSGAKLATFGNGGTEVSSLMPDGSLYSGIGGDFSSSDHGFTYYSTTENGGFSNWELVMRALTNISSNVGTDFVVSGRQNNQLASITLESLGPSVNNVFDVTLNQSSIGARLTLDVNSSQVTKVWPSAPDGTTPYTYDTSLAHTSGNLMEVKNMGTNIAALSYTGELDLTGPAPGIYVDLDGIRTVLVENDPSRDTPQIKITGTNSTTRLFPGMPDGSTPFTLETETTHTSGNLVEFKNNGTLKERTTFDGVKATVGGFASTATDAAVTIAATGWTNTFGKNAVVYVDGIGLTYKVADNAGTFIYTNSVALAGASILLQPLGKVIITAGTLGMGRATSF